jgi:hypothetical protein
MMLNNRAMPGPGPGVGIAAPTRIQPGPTPAIVPNTGMVPHPVVQAGPVAAPQNPAMGINRGELGTPWARRFAR